MMLRIVHHRLAGHDDSACNAIARDIFPRDITTKFLVSRLLSAASGAAGRELR
jgi:hypothetical protein